MILSAIFIVCAVQSVQPDPAANLVAAKAHIAAGKHAGALELLDAALEATAHIASDEERTQARTALHFYAAVASSALRREEEARAHLDEVLRLSPHIRSIDQKLYPPAFVKLFEQARGDAADTTAFEEMYPGVVSSDAVREVEWESTAIQVLGSKKEKNAWRDATTPEQRARVSDDFWRVRDRTPDTPRNEFRESVAQRIAFADANFGSPAVRGASTDRGRVFVTLGAPAAVRRRMLRSDERVVAMSRGGDGIESGLMETWMYTSEQLAGISSKPAVGFRFVTHQGIGEHVLQRDGIAMNVLAAAGAHR